MKAQIKKTEEKKFNIAIIQIHDDNIKEYADYSRLLNAMYAYEKGYTYINFEYDLVPVYVSVYYNKILAIKAALNDERKFDWVLYIDSDAAICNFKYTIEEIINRHPDKEIILAQDHNGINNGVFLIKNTDNMKSFLEKSYADNNFYHTKTPEQSAMFHHLQTEEFKYLIGLESPHHFNAYLQGYNDLQSRDDVKYWDKESFIVHFFRLSNEDRMSLFKQILMQKNIICITKPKEVSKIKQ